MNIEGREGQEKKGNKWEIKKNLKKEKDRGRKKGRKKGILSLKLCTKKKDWKR